VWQQPLKSNRFNGLPHTIETVETVGKCFGSMFTQLMQGVNEREHDNDRLGVKYQD
jgi:hypothetical protein